MNLQIRPQALGPAMHFRPSAMLLLLALLMSSCSQVPNADFWLDRLLPLPQEIRIDGDAQVALQEIGLRWPASFGTDDAEFGELLQPLDQGGDWLIEFVLIPETTPEQIDAWKQAIAGISFPEQAYTIAPQKSDGRFSGLQITAQSKLGLWYGAQSLRRLLALDSLQTALVLIPQVWIRDWPDIEHRGQWGWNFIGDLDWMAAHKFNVVEMHSNLGFDESGRPQASFDEQMLAACRRRHIRVVPVIRHLELLAVTGLFRHHPETASIPQPGKPLPNDYQPGVCFSQPRTVELLSGWIDQLLAEPGVDEVNVWLSETEAGCYCDRCLGQDPFVLETEGVCRAFKRVQDRHPGDVLHILLSQASYAHNAAILQAIDPGVRVTFYHGGLTYDSSHRPMIDSLLAAYSGSGGWLGVYPQLTSSWRTIFPFSSVHLMQARMQEFSRKGLRSFRGYAPPRNDYYRPTIAAAAEWGWNCDGRTVAEFSRAFAGEQGIPEPRAYARWVEQIGPVGWQLAGSRTVQELIFAAGGQIFVDGVISQGKIEDKFRALHFGGWLLEEFHDRGELEGAIESARRALQTAENKGTAAMCQESEAVLATLVLLQNLQQLAEQQAAGTLTPLRAAEIFAVIDVEGSRISKAVSRWGQSVVPVKRTELHERFRDSVDFPAFTAELARRAFPFADISDSLAVFRSQPLGGWHTESFAAPGDTCLFFAVEGDLLQPGSIDVVCLFDSGASGIDFHRAELLYGRSAAEALPVDIDRFNFRLNRYHRVSNFWLEVPAVDRQAGGQFFVRLRVTGPTPDLPGDRRTTFGRILLRRSWREWPLL